MTRTLEWSDAGELLRDGNDTYQWDAAGRMVQATVDGVTSRYAYLGDGARISMTVGGETTTYTLDLTAPLVQVLVANEDGESTAYLYGVARIGEYDDAWRYHLADHVGSVRSLLDADESVAGTRAYQPYGLPLSSAGTASSIYGFAGEQTDPTGLIFLRARMYAPYLNRFISPDTIIPDFRNPQSLNRFLYVNNNPVNFTDPSGHCSDSPDEYEDYECRILPRAIFEEYPGRFDYDRLRRTDYAKLVRIVYETE